MSDPEQSGSGARHHPDTDGLPDASVNSWHMLKRLWRTYMSVYKARISGALVFMLLLAAANAAMPLTVEWVFSAFSERTVGNFRATPEQVIYFGPVILLAVGSAIALTQFISVVLAEGASIHVLEDLQRDMYKNYLTFDFAQSRDAGGAKIASRFTNDVLLLRESMTRGPRSIREIASMIGSLGVMIYYDWMLLMVVLVIYPLAGIPVIRIGRRLRQLAGRLQHQIGDMLGLLTESMRGARMVKTYSLEAYETKRAVEAFRARRKILTRAAYVKAATAPMIQMIGTVAVAIVVSLAAFRITQGDLDGPQLIGFIVALTLLSQPARSLGNLNAILQEGFAALERVFWVIDLRPTITDPPAAKQLDMTPKADTPMIRFRDVGFAYEDGVVLSGLCLEVPAGKTVALVGESGAGKSTIFNLLPRLYDIDEGSIEINGQDISTLSLQSLRRSMSLVSQDAILFDDTVAANIGFGADALDDVTMPQLEEAARLAAAMEFIGELPGRMAYPVGDSGSNLSGGQRQRVALARAFLKDAPILLLDEATSALDAESEHRVQEALGRLARGRTTLVIAHRLSTIRDADLICVMDRGRVVEQGSHEALLAKGGFYKKLYRLQFDG